MRPDEDWMTPVISLVSEMKLRILDFSLSECLLLVATILVLVIEADAAAERGGLSSSAQRPTPQQRRLAKRISGLLVDQNMEDIITVLAMLTHQGAVMLKECDREDKERKRAEARGS